MIEFSLRIDSRITRAVTPLIIKCFSECGKVSPVFPKVDEKDIDLLEAWEESLKEDLAQDRQSLARLLNNPKFTHGYIEVDENEAEYILRAITEIRLHIRETKLESFTDVELETGDFTLPKKSQSTQSHYLAYLVLAEVQEGLIAEMV